MEKQYFLKGNIEEKKIIYNRIEYPADTSKNKRDKNYIKSDFIFCTKFQFISLN